MLSMNKLSSTPSMKDVLICGSYMYAFVDCVYMGKSNCVIQQVNATRGFSAFNNPDSNTYNHG